MSKFIVFLIFFSHAILVFGDAEVLVERLKDRYLPYSNSSKFVQVEDSSLPELFRSAHPLVSGSSFVFGYSLKNQVNPMVILEIEKPKLSKDELFCRSKISVFILYDYDGRKEYPSVLRNSFQDVSELVSFELSDVSNKCLAETMGDMGGYIFINGLVADDSKVSLYERVLAMFQESIILEFGLTRFGEGGFDMRYYVVLKPCGECSSELIVL